MQNVSVRRIAAESALIIGIVFTILGGGILMAGAGGGSYSAAALASSCVIIGVLLASISIRLQRKARYLFLASFLIQSGIFLLLISSGLLAFPFSRLWPMLSVFAGLSLIPAGWHRYGRLNSRFVVPALAFVLLGCGFLVFSFGLLPFSFKRFILIWWPLLLLLAGILLLLISLSARASGSEESGS